MFDVDAYAGFCGWNVMCAPLLRQNEFDAVASEYHVRCITCMTPGPKTSEEIFRLHCNVRIRLPQQSTAYDPCLQCRLDQESMVALLVL